MWFWSCFPFTFPNWWIGAGHCNIKWDKCFPSEGPWPYGYSSGFRMLHDASWCSWHGGQKLQPAWSHVGKVRATCKCQTCLMMKTRCRGGSGVVVLWWCCGWLWGHVGHHDAESLAIQGRSECDSACRMSGRGGWNSWQESQLCRMLLRGLPLLDRLHRAEDAADGSNHRWLRMHKTQQARTVLKPHPLAKAKEKAREREREGNSNSSWISLLQELATWPRRICQSRRTRKMRQMRYRQGKQNLHDLAPSSILVWNSLELLASGMFGDVWRCFWLLLDSCGCWLDYGCLWMLMVACQIKVFFLLATLQHWLWGSTRLWWAESQFLTGKLVFRLLCDLCGRAEGCNKSLPLFERISSRFSDGFWFRSGWGGWYRLGAGSSNEKRRGVFLCFSCCFPFSFLL